MNRSVSRVLVLGSILSLMLVAAAPIPAAPGPPPSDRYIVTPLVSNKPGVAPTPTRTSRTPGGSRAAATSPWWVADNGAQQDDGLQRRRRAPDRSAGIRSRRHGAPTGSRVLRDPGPVPGRDDVDRDARHVELHLRRRGRHDPRVARRLDGRARDRRHGARPARCSRAWRSRTAPSRPAALRDRLRQRARRRLRRRLDTTSTTPAHSRIRT